MQHIALTSGCDSINFERKKKEGDTLGMNGAVPLTVRLREMKTGISEASKRVSIFDRETGSKPERLRSGFLQADLSLIV